MIHITLDQWNEWMPLGYRHLPYIVSFSIEHDRPETWEPFWPKDEPCVVLESGKGGRYTLAARRPVSIIRGRDREATVTEKNGESLQLTDSPPLKAVQEWMAPWHSPRVEGVPKFTGGCIGYWSYDIVRSLERLPQSAEDDLGIPEFMFMRFDRLWIIDHTEKILYCTVYTDVENAADTDSRAGSGRPDAEAHELAALYDHTGRAAEEMRREWERLMEPAPGEPQRIGTDAERRQAFDRFRQQDQLQIDVESWADMSRSFSRDAFIQAVEKIQSYIRQGDIFQVNLSVRQSRPLQSSPEDIYEWLRLLNPSPYMGYLSFPGLALVSASPELLVRLEDRLVETRPIAGTRRRGRDEAEDRHMADELAASEKERAEHIMLVDLLRNDLGRISRYGSVRVNELMTIERYSHVMHIVSNVQGELAEGKNEYDVLAALFPGGTITGAPKIRTMEIIEELEPVRRGPYTGSIGWIDYNGNMEFNITIRTLVLKDGVGHIQAGAGIVIDSVPEREYRESLSKAKALWKAVEYSEKAAKARWEP